MPYGAVPDRSYAIGAMERFRSFVAEGADAHSAPDTGLLHKSVLASHLLWQRRRVNSDNLNTGIDTNELRVALPRIRPNVGAGLRPWGRPIHRIRGSIEKFFETWKRSDGLQGHAMARTSEGGLQIPLHALFTLSHCFHHRNLQASWYFFRRSLYPPGRQAAPARTNRSPSGRVRLRVSVRLGRRVRQSSQHGDQGPVVEDGEPFA